VAIQFFSAGVIPMRPDAPQSSKSSFPSAARRRICRGMNSRATCLARWLFSAALAAGALASRPVAAQDAPAGNPAKPSELESRFDALNQRVDALEKAVDDVLWYDKVGDVAVIDKVFMVGPPPAHPKNPTAMGATNPVKFWSYVFLPRQLDRSKKAPLIVLPHGGVHADFTTYHTHIIREMMAQGYVVVAPEYRGSTGYGEGFYRQIDYGGLEIGDVHAARDWMVENYDFIDAARVGIVGWSHGGLIALMEIFEHPQDYKVAFAGVPVSDLVARLGYQDEEYRKEFAAPYHIGKTVNEDVNEYLRRSPVTHVDKLQTPLLIHTNTNDDDVYVLEVQKLIDALKAAGKKFDYEVFQNAPGGHSFDRIDTKLAKQIRVKIYTFLAQYLDPPTPIRTLEALQKAGYR
jgi:dienelactone hydrolase